MPLLTVIQLLPVGPMAPSTEALRSGLGNVACVWINTLFSNLILGYKIGSKRPTDHAVNTAGTD
jgi:hypothetical protein